MKEVDLFDTPVCRNHLELFNWARDCGVVGVHQQAVLWALCSRVEIKSGECHPSIAQIMEDAKLSRAAVFKALDKLVEDGLLERKSGKGRRVSSTYRPRFGEKVSNKNVSNGDHLKGLHQIPIPGKRSPMETKKVSNGDTGELPLENSTPSIPQTPDGGERELPLTREEIRAMTQPTTDEAIALDWSTFPVTEEAVIEVMKRTLPGFRQQLNGVGRKLTPKVLAGLYRVSRSDGKTWDKKPLQHAGALEWDGPKFLGYIVLNPTVAVQQARALKLIAEDTETGETTKTSDSQWAETQQKYFKSLGIA